MSKYKKHSKEFKARVALEAIKGHKTIAEISSEYGVHPTQITRWKQEVESNLAKVFEKNKQASKELKEKNKQLEQALKELGQVTLEASWLKKKLAPYD